MSANPVESHTVLRAVELRIGYTADVVLDHVFIDVRMGEVTAINGRTGSGKSTLLNVLSLLARPLAGDVALQVAPQSAAISYAGLTVKRRNQVMRDNFGYVFQRTELIDYWNASANIGLPLLSRRVPPEERRRIVGDVCGRLRLDLEDLDRRSVARLSGGQRQRVGLARALAANPKILFADEPFGSLDRATADEVTDHFFSAVRQQGVAAVLVSHDEASVKRCDREYRIDGKTLTRVR